MKLKLDVQALCWAEARPKNVRGLVGVFPLHSQHRKQEYELQKCENVVLFFILF